MNRTFQILSAVVWASIVAGCGTSSDAGLDAGVDAGFHYTRLSEGTAILSGAVTGTAGANAFAFYNPIVFPLPDGGNYGPSVYFQVSNAVPPAPGPDFGCGFRLLLRTTLEAGIYTPSNVSELQCTAENVPDGGGDPEFWGNVGVDFGPPSAFALVLTSPGPVDSYSSGANWNDPSGTAYVYMAPGPGQTEGFGFSVTFAPPPCPAYCASNTP